MLGYPGVVIEGRSSWQIKIYDMISSRLSEVCFAVKGRPATCRSATDIRGLHVRRYAVVIDVKFIKMLVFRCKNDAAVSDDLAADISLMDIGL